MNLSVPPISLGWIIALLVLVVALVLWLTSGVTPDRLLALIGALAVARMT